MFTSIIGAIGSLLKIVSTALGWAHDASEVKQGEQLQAGADLQATVKDDSDAQKIDASVATQSRADLLDELRGPAPGSK